MALDAELSELRMMLGGGAPRPPVASTSSSKPKDTVEADDEDEEDSLEGEEDESEDEGSDASEGMNDEELEAALNSAGKSGVDRELLRKLIGGGGDSDSEPDDDAKFPAETFDNDLTERPPPAEAAPRDHDPYDSYVRLLALEPRAHASDRLKTPLELAKEAAEELKEREEARLRRQRGEVDETEAEASGKPKKQQKRKPEGDDLEDDFDMEGGDSDEGSEEEGLGKGLEGGFGHQVIEDQSEEEEVDEDDEDEDEDEDEDDEELDLEESEDEGAEDSSAPEALVSSVIEEPIKSRTWGGKDIKPELPFTFPCPSTHSEFARLLDKSGIAEADTATVVKRIRVLYHPGLGEDNKFKLQVSCLSFPSLS